MFLQGNGRLLPRGRGQVVFLGKEPLAKKEADNAEPDAGESGAQLEPGLLIEFWGCVLFDLGILRVIFLHLLCWF